MPYANTSRLRYLIFSVLFITACSPLSATTVEKATPVDKITNTVSVDRERAIQQWIKARSAYEKTLDYSSLEQEKKYRYQAMRKLVEAKYFLTLAEKDLQYNSDKSVVLDDFNLARHLIEQAMTTIDSNSKSKLETIHKQLDKMRQSIKHDIAAETQWLPEDQRDEFDSILTKIEDILTQP